MPAPIAAYDTCRRLFIGGLPPACTRQDVINLIKNRTRATPAHVEIALVKSMPSSAPLTTDGAAEDAVPAPAPPPPPPRKNKFLDSSDDDDDDDDDGEKQQKRQDAAAKVNSKKNTKKEKKPLRPCRGFAHVTVEGLKSVMESLQGAVILDSKAPLTIQQAKPHFMFKIEKAKRDREREEETKREEALQKTKEPGYGELDKSKPGPRKFEAAKNRFGNIASEIAAKLRQRAKERKARSQGFASAADMEMARKNPQQLQQLQRGGGRNNYAQQLSGKRRPRDDNNADNINNNQHQRRVPPNSAARGTPFNKKPVAAGSVYNKKQPSAAAAVPPPPPPPTPKEKEVVKKDKKLSALELRLAALQAKLKGNA